MDLIGPVLVSRPLPRGVADRCMPPGHLGQPIVRRPFVGVDQHRRPGHLPDERPERRAVGPVHYPEPEEPRFAAHYPGDRGTVVGLRAVPRPSVGAAPRRVGGVGMRDAYFPPRSGTSRRPRPPGRPAAPGRRPSAPDPGAGAGASVGVAGAGLARGPAARSSRPGRSLGGSAGPPRAAGGSLGRRSPVKALNTRQQASQR